MWDTNWSLYEQEEFLTAAAEAKASAAPPAAGDDRSDMLVQDVVLPGYLGEWEKTRKVGGARAYVPW